ncbi:MAG: 3-hydroxyacyl-CoA dehydrogenase family protein [Nitrososphaerota archaeon]
MKIVAIIGSGTMGHGIAQIAAMSGYNVILYGRSSESIENAIFKIKSSLQKLLKKGVISEKDVEKTLDRILPTTSLDEKISEASIIVEAVVEDLLIKQSIYLSIEKIVQDDAVISTTTSAIPITELQKRLDNPSRVIGAHFFNPPQVMKLVEIMAGRYTSIDTIDRCINFVKSLNKVPLILNMEIPGYVVNRILLEMFLTAISIVEAGEATPIEIDYILKKRYGIPMGLFELADFIGLDIVHSSLKILNMFDKKFRPSLTIEMMVSKGFLGIKSQRGFYEYPRNNRYEAHYVPSFDKEQYIARIIFAGINAAKELINMGVTNMESIDMAVKLGLNFSKGISEYERMIYDVPIEQLVIS